MRTKKLIQRLAADDPNVWVEELLLRGRPGESGGVIHGAHIVIGVQTPDDDDPDDQPQRQTFGPFPIDALPDTPAMASVLGTVSRGQQKRIDEQDTEIASLKSELEGTRGELAAELVKSEKLSAQIETRGRELAEAAKVVTALLTEIASYKKQQPVVTPD